MPLEDKQVLESLNNPNVSIKDVKINFDSNLNIIIGQNDKSYASMTQKRELENYNIEDIPTFIKNKSENKDTKAIKGILNGKLTKLLTKEHLEDLQAFDEIKI